MSRYVFKFYKLGNMRFISHLDLQRVFTRAMRRANIGLIYSLGYNPHPKISIVQPLSLGFETDSDYFEIETAEEKVIDEMLSAINDALPSGIKFFDGRVLPLTGKTLSSIVEFAKYEVFLPLEHTESINERLKEFCEQNIITVNKRDKKTQKTILKDIKSFIRTMELESVAPDGIILHMILRSASNESLNPLNLAEALCEFLHEPFHKDLSRVCRKDMYIQEGDQLVSLGEYTYAAAVVSH